MMDDRDEFAAAALMAAPEQLRNINSPPQALAGWCYHVADAMLEEREATRKVDAAASFESEIESLRAQTRGRS